jgi:hypothetical protein
VCRGNRAARGSLNSLRRLQFASYIRAVMNGPVGSMPTALITVARATLNVASFFAALIAVCTTVAEILLFPRVDVTCQKWAHFEENKDQYDALFLRSSRLGPGKLSALSKPGHRFDPGHLNPAGAQVVTELLASRFVKLVADVK